MRVSLRGFERGKSFAYKCGLLAVVGYCVAYMGGCRSNHHVSPWPKDVSIQDLWQPTSLQQHIERMDRELSVEGMTLSVQLDGQFASGDEFCIRSYRGVDGLKNAREAVRVATKYGVVMALGPVSSHQALQGRGVSLIEMVQEGGWRSGTDFNGDGLVDVVVMRDSNELEIWAIYEQGAAPYPVRSAVSMQRMVDVNHDGRPELLGYVAVSEQDVVAPRFGEVLFFSGGSYVWDHSGARKWHENQALQLQNQAATIGQSSVPLGNVLALAWHRIRAGQQRELVLKWLDEQAKQRPELTDRAVGLLAGDVDGWWTKWRGWLQTVEQGKSKKVSPSRKTSDKPVNEHPDNPPVPTPITKSAVMSASHYPP